MSVALEITSLELAERMQRSKSWRRALVVSSNGRCHYCNRSGVSEEVGPDDRVWHVDHKNPIARGGSDDDSNLVLACARCNLTKSVQPYKQFRDFARAAYWVPDDWRASEFDLDLLMSQYTDALEGWRVRHAQDPTWRVNQDKCAIDFVDADGDRAVLFGWDCRDYESAYFEPQKYNQHYRDDALTHLDLVVRMHQMMPALVAEIRMLRGERVADDHLNGRDLPE